MELEKGVQAYKSSFAIGMIIAVVLLLSAACGYITYHYNYIKYWDNLVYPGIKVEGIDLSGKTRAEALAIVKKVSSDQISKGKINISASEKNYTLGYSDIGAKADIDSAIDKAYSYGKNLSLLHKFILLKNPKDTSYKLGFSYNKESIRNLTKTIEQELTIEPVNASLSIQGNNFSTIPERQGRKVDRDKLEKEILYSLDKGMSSDVQVSVSTQILEPKIKGNMINNINSRIGGFTTSFGSISSSERANNIILSTRSINGKILMPGDVFSFNDVVGERTSRRGYQSAPVIVNNKLESGVGGGVCQVSTTLYNAVNNSGIASLERVSHTLHVSYVPTGMDATVDYGNIDYKFKNSLNYPIYIQAYTLGGNLTFNLYSNREVVK